MENIYTFMLEYMDCLRQAEKNGYKISSDFHKPLKFYEEIKTRATEDSSFEDDDLCKACYKMYHLFFNHQHKDVYSDFLKHWGIKEKPYKVLYVRKQAIPSRKYVLAFFVNHTEDEDQCRNYGLGERFYGNGKSETPEQFFEEIQKQYRDCDWCELLNVSEVYTEPEFVQYEYNGSLYREYN